MASPTLYASRSFVKQNLDHKPLEPPSGGWASIIGIVVALVGNVLISVALNTQRYAHIRLSRERDSRGGQSTAPRRSGVVNGAYGTSQSQNGRGQKGSVGAEDGLPKTRFQESRAHQDETQPLLRKTSQNGALHENEEDEDDIKEDDGSGDSKDKTYLSSPWWWLGIILMIIGESGNFLAYGFAPASVVSPLGVVALISNCLIAPWMLHERFRKRDALGVLIAVAGCVVVVLSASGDNPKLDARKIWELISTWEFETYFGITLALIIILMFASNKYGEKSILIDLGLVGLFGGYTALSTKGVASLLSNTIWRIVTFPVTYLLVAVLVFTAVMQIKYVNRALQRFDSTQVIPTQFVMFTLSVIIGSAVLYQDFRRKSTEDALKFFSGCALTFLGVYCITSGRSRDREGDEGDTSSDEEEGIHLDVDDGVDRHAEIEQFLDVETSPSSKPQAGRSLSSRSETPALRLHTQGDAISTTQDPAETLRESTLTATKPPGVSAAIHHTPSRIRPDNPNQTHPPPLHATTSEPLLPTSALSEPSPDLLRHRGSPIWRQNSHERPRTPDNHIPPVETGSSSTVRFGSIGRHSLADILPHPGPLTNPLSNSLSAIVADSLRRGVDVSKSIRRRSIRHKRSRRQDEGLGFGRSLGETSLEAGFHHPPQPSEGMAARRRPSPGATTDTSAGKRPSTTEGET